MYDTQLTLVGNALTTPEWRRTTQTNTLVAHFKVASHSRRFDRATGRWVDGDSLRVRVTCWRRLAEGVCASIMSGDPVIVTGRMYTRDWTADDGSHRVAYELEATSVGHDLARGETKFVKRTANHTTVTGEDEDGDRIHGEPTEPVDPLAGRRAHARPVHLGDDGYADEDDSYANGPGSENDALAILRSAGLDPNLIAAPTAADDADDLARVDEAEAADAADGADGADGSEDLDGTDEEEDGSGKSDRPARRRARRQPVAA